MNGWGRAGQVHFLSFTLVCLGSFHSHRYSKIVHHCLLRLPKEEGKRCETKSQATLKKAPKEIIQAVELLSLTAKNAKKFNEKVTTIFKALV